MCSRQRECTKALNALPPISPDHGAAWAIEVIVSFEYRSNEGGWIHTNKILLVNYGQGGA